MKKAITRLRSNPLVHDAGSSNEVYPDWESRLRAVEQSRHLSTAARRKALTQALGDPSELVRVAVMDELEIAPIPDLRSGLLSALSDSSELVRSHSVRALMASPKSNDRILFELHLTRSRSLFRVALLCALIASGRPEALDDLIAHILTTKNYLDVCSAARIVCVLTLDAESQRRILKAFRAAQQRLRSVAVDDAMRFMRKGLR